MSQAYMVMADKRLVSLDVSIGGSQKGLKEESKAQYLTVNTVAMWNTVGKKVTYITSWINLDKPEALLDRVTRQGKGD